MFENFCIAQSLRSLITVGQLPDVLSPFVDIFTRTFRDDRSRGTLISESRAFKIKFSVKPDATSHTVPSRRLTRSMFSAIQKWKTKNYCEDSNLLLGTTSSKPCSSVVMVHDSLEKDGILYKPHMTPSDKEPQLPTSCTLLSPFDTSRDDDTHCLGSNPNDPRSGSVDTSHCFVAFHDDTSFGWSAGRIREILTHESSILIIVDPFRALLPADAHHDHHRMYPISGGRIFYDEPEQSPVVISPTELKCHVALVQNVSDGIVTPHCLIIPLDRVRAYSCHLTVFF